MPEVKFELVKWELSFAEDLVKNANNNNIAKNLRNVFPNPYTIEHAKEWIEFCNNVDEVRIFAESFACNIGSRRALEKVGFKLEDVMERSVYKNNQIQDSYMYELTKKV